MPIMFTMNADALDFVTPGVLAGMSGLKIHFDLNIDAGSWLRVTGGPRTILLHGQERITGYVRSDGRMYDTAAVSPVPYDLDDPGSLGVRLLANDPNLNLENDVSYYVSGVGDLHGRPWIFSPFNTSAVPSVDTTADLASFTPGPGQTVVGIPALGLVDDLGDMTAVGKAVARATDASAARAAIGVDLIGLDELNWYANVAAFPSSGQTSDKVYGARDTGRMFRWSGVAYVPASQTVDSTDIIDSTSVGRSLVTSADAAAARTTLVADPLVGRGNAVVFMGDSLTGRGCVPRTTDAGSIAVGGLVQMVLSRVPSLRYLFNAGVGGDGTPGMVSRWAADVVAYSPTVLFLEGGGNDVSNPSISETTTITNLRFMIRDAKRIGCVVFLCTIPPRSDSSLYRDNIERVNGGIRRLAAYEGAHLIDFYGALVDPATGYYAAGMSDDTVHPNSDGNRIIANLSASIMNRALPAGGLPVAQAQYVGTPNRMPNSCMLDDTNADGVPDYWTAGGSATTSTISRVDDDDFLGKACQIQFTGAATKYITTSISISLAPVGSTIAFCGKYKADVEAGSGTYRIDLLFHNTTNTNYYHLRPVFDVDYDTDGVGYFYMEGVVPPATDRLDITVIALTGAGTLKVGQFAVWVLDEDGKPI